MSTLDELRNHIDEIDAKMIALFAERMETVEKIGNLKKEQNIPVMRYSREVEIINNAKKMVKPEFEKSVEKFFNSLFEISRNRQCELLEE